MKVWVDTIAKWVVAEPLPPVKYRMGEEELKALLARPVAPRNPGRWMVRWVAWVTGAPLLPVGYCLGKEELKALLARPTAPKNPGRWVDRARKRTIKSEDAG